MGRRLPVTAALLVVLAAVSASPAQARSRAPHLRKARCLSGPDSSCRGGAAIGAIVRLYGRGLYRGLRASFHWRRGAIATRTRRRHGRVVVRVPAGTPAGRVKIRVRGRNRRYSNYVRVRIAKPKPKPVVVQPSGGVPAALVGNGMWIWELAKSEGGNPAAIAARAHAAGIATVFVKSADGTNVWSQFSPSLVQALHAYGLHVCAWQYVYGSNPVGEAQAALAAVADGADCFVIDAESQYEGRYGAAQRYIATLRGALGPSYPIGLTSFPYVDYHPALPYSVFLAPGAAQANLPQVYWKAIGGGVDAVSAHTYAHNRIYPAPLFPLGQAYDAPAPADIVRFRQLWASYGTAGLSWWSWQSASPATWSTLAAPAPARTFVADPGWPALEKGSSGDEVIWLQQHLSSQDPTVAVDGDFGPLTDAALRRFQASRGLPATGVTDPATWQAVLALALHPVDWTAARPARASAARVPQSRDEIPPAWKRR